MNKDDAKIIKTLRKQGFTLDENCGTGCEALVAPNGARIRIGQGGKGQSHDLPRWARKHGARL